MYMETDRLCLGELTRNDVPALPLLNRGRAFICKHSGGGRENPRAFLARGFPIPYNRSIK